LVLYITKTGFRTQYAAGTCFYPFHFLQDKNAAANGNPAWH
jgi:hypothetical protein